MKKTTKEIILWSMIPTIYLTLVLGIVYCVLKLVDIIHWISNKFFSSSPDFGLIILLTFIVSTVLCGYYGYRQTKL